MQHSRYMSWSRNLYILGLLLATAFIIPTAWFPFQLGKVAVMGVFLFVSAVLFVLGGGVAHMRRAKGFLPSLLVLALPAAYLVSYMLSTDRTVGFTGYALEGDTVVFSLMTVLVFLFGTALFKTTWSIRRLLMAVTGVAAFVGVFQYVVILFGTNLVPFQIFSDRSTNLVGKWNDLGILLGLAFFLVLTWIEFGDLPKTRKMLLGVGAAALALLLAIVQFPLAWALLLCLSLVVATWSFLSKRSRSEGFAAVPWVPVTVSLVSAIFLMWGATFNTNIATVFPVSSLEVRPSFGSTLDIVKAAHGSSISDFLFGTGPQTYGAQWLHNKPLAVNQSPFWNLDFNVGFSTVVTMLESVGVLGVLALLIPLLLVFLGAVRVLRSTQFTQGEKGMAWSLGLGVAYLWSSMLFYVPSQNIILLSFALAGAVYGYMMRTSQEEETAEPASVRVMQPLAILIALALVVLTGWVGIVAAKRYVAEMYTNQGLAALQQGNADMAMDLANKALGADRVGDALRLSVDAHNAKIQQLASAATNVTKEQQQQFLDLTKETISLGQEAVAANPNDYRAYISLARVYDFLATLKVQGAYESAKQEYMLAQTKNPTNPVIALALARLEAGQGNINAVEAALTQALTLKPDYTDAILLVVQLEVAKKDIPTAIRAAQAAVRSAPGVAPIWFQLGLLYYASNDTADAVSVLEQAVKIQADYANAKYFLGLSYAAQNKPQDAIQQFMDLQRTNPDNKEVQLILSNLQAGRPPFAGAQPPVTPTPQARPTAPISQ